jgi:hypothetical protein
MSVDSQNCYDNLAIEIKAPPSPRTKPADPHASHGTEMDILGLIKKQTDSLLKKRRASLISKLDEARLGSDRASTSLLTYEIRALPEFKEASVPPHWRMHTCPTRPPPNKYLDHYELVDLSETTQEYADIREDFMSTFGYMTPQCFQVKRIENYKLYNRYFLKKQHFLHKRLMPNEAANEMMLYHGTRSEHVASICRYGFDLNLSKPEQRVLGKGIYFSRYSGNSHFYTDFQYGHLKHMFRARVLLGDLGDGFVYNCEHMFDSTKDPTEQNFCVFDNEQCYPEYLIVYC